MAYLRLIDVTNVDAADIELHYYNRVQTWLVCWLLYWLTGAGWSFDADMDHTHIVDCMRNGAAVRFFPVNEKGYARLCKLTRLDNNPFGEKQQ